MRGSERLGRTRAAGRELRKIYARHCCTFMFVFVGGLSSAPHSTAQHATAQHGFNCAKEMPDASRDGAMVMVMAKATAMAMANGANKQQ